MRWVDAWVRVLPQLLGCISLVGVPAVRFGGFIGLHVGFLVQLGTFLALVSQALILHLRSITLVLEHLLALFSAFDGDRLLGSSDWQF